MTGFQGRAHIKIDPKGRLHLPTSFANVLKKSSRVVVTNSVFRGEKFLDFHSLAEWSKLEARIALLPQLKSEVQSFQRFYLSSGEVIELDSQSRVLIPQHLREYAGLGSEIVLIGMGRKIEIWNDKKWRAHFGEIVTNFDQILSVISDLDERHSERNKK